MQSWTSPNPHAIIAGVSVSCVASRPGYPVHPVHPCSIYSPSRLIFPVAGLGCAQRPDSQSASRAAASGPINPLPWVAAQFPCDSAPVHRVGGNRMGPAQAEPGRLCRSIRVEEMGEALPVLCGRDARAPGWASSHDARISRSRYRRCIRVQLVIEGGPSLFVFIRAHWWFVFKNDRLFLPRMIRPVVGGAGPACLKQHPELGGWRPAQGQAWVVGLFTWMHRMHRIFSEDRWLAVLDIRKSALDH